MYGSIVSGIGIAKQLNEENKKTKVYRYVYRCKVAVSCLTLFFCLVQTGHTGDTLRSDEIQEYAPPNNDIHRGNKGSNTM